MLQTYLVVMAGGALGSGLRMWLFTVVAARFGEAFPFGTIAVNVLGSFLIGVFAALTGPEGFFLTSRLMRFFVMVGLLGGFTTFSSFSLQTVTLIDQGYWLRAGLNAGLSVMLCLGAVWLGQLAAGPVNQRLLS